jgi:hypothetical protein
MQPEHHDKPLTAPVSCFVEVALPLPMSHAWVAYACRTAGVAKPRWNPTARVWTTSTKGESGAYETISITNGTGPKCVRVSAEWLAPESDPAETATTRRLVTAFMTGMMWAVRRRS